MENRATFAQSSALPTKDARRHAKHKALRGAVGQPHAPIMPINAETIGIAQKWPGDEKLFSTKQSNVARHKATSWLAMPISALLNTLFFHRVAHCRFTSRKFAPLVDDGRSALSIVVHLRRSALLIVSNVAKQRLSAQCRSTDKRSPNASAGVSHSIGVFPTLASSPNGVAQFWRVSLNVARAALCRSASLHIPLRRSRPPWLNVIQRRATWRLPTIGQHRRE